MIEEVEVGSESRTVEEAQVVVVVVLAAVEGPVAKPNVGDSYR
jgi:hypothetical protein